ncbi:MAG TPA: TonB-dependent receptor [Desulfuromonadales bacterium]|nr:TonB-dependent receptor [Desulfuromonadales bacterium]
MKHRSRIKCLIVPLFLIVSSPLHAQGQNPETLSPVVVTAARSEQPVETAPAHVTVIELDDIRRSGARTVPDLLKAEAGIRVRNLLGNGKTAQVDLRGFGESASANTLVLVDGRRVNAVDLSGTDWLQIPIEQIERVEIVRGSGSILYGDNASGGVINIMTRTPDQEIDARLGAEFGSYDDDRQWATLGGGSEQFAFSLSGSMRDTEGYRDNGFLDSEDLGGSFRFYPTDRLTLGLSGSIHEDDYGMPGALTADEMQNDRESTTNPDDKASTRDRYMRGISDFDFGKGGNLSLELSVRDRETNSDFVSSGFQSESDLDTWSLTPRYQWKGEIFEVRHQITAGADFYWSDLDSRSESGFGDSSASVEKDTEGYYVYDRIDITESLLLNAGMRYEQARYSLDQQDSNLASLHGERDMDENTWTAGLTWLYADHSSAYLRLNRSFRFPLTDEMVEYDFLGGRILINEDLRPQTGIHYEAGIRHQFLPGIAGNIAFFRADIDEEIFLNPLTFANENHPETRHEGMETGLELAFGDHFEVDTSYTYTRAKFEAAPFEDNDIPAVPRHQASARVGVEDLYPGLTFSALYRFVGRRYAISDQANILEKIGSHDIVDLHASYGRDHWSVYAGVKNVFDEKYSDYVVASDSDFNGAVDRKNYYPAPERNWVAGLKVSY